MAQSRGKTARSQRGKWLQYALALIFGGGTGIGGLIFKDHPVLQGLFARETGLDPNDASSIEKEGLRQVAGAISRFGAYSRPGTFEVKVTSVKLDPKTFREGQTLDLQVLLIKREAEKRDSTIWDSHSLGDRNVVVGKGDLSTGWDDQPIRVAWKPGDIFVLEVWDRRRIIHKKWYEWTAHEESSFPLRSGSYPLSLAERGSSIANPSVSQVVLEARPLTDGDQDAQVAGKHDGTIRIR